MLRVSKGPGLVVMQLSLINIDPGFCASFADLKTVSAPWYFVSESDGNWRVPYKGVKTHLKNLGF